MLKKKIKPDYNLVYADRFETFGATIASTQMNIPTIHIEGGDKTEGGTLDDSVRHAMTKISHIHITTNENAKKRIIKLGEENGELEILDIQLWIMFLKKITQQKKKLKKNLNLK